MPRKIWVWCPTSHFSSKPCHELMNGICRLPLAFHLAMTLMGTLRTCHGAQQRTSLFVEGEVFSFGKYLCKALLILELFTRTDLYFFNQVVLAISAISIYLPLTNSQRNYLSLCAGFGWDRVNFLHSSLCEGALDLWWKQC